MSDYSLVQKNYYGDEFEILEHLNSVIDIDKDLSKKAYDLSISIITELRKIKNNSLNMDSLLSTYKLSTQEGISLMCLAEALLRIPDIQTQNELIADKILGRDWSKFVSKDQNTATNVLSLGIIAAEKILAGSKIIKIEMLTGAALSKTVTEAMKVVCKQFVLDYSIEKAMKTSENYAKKGYKFSYDMLGEGARTKADSDKFFSDYEKAIEVIGSNNSKQSSISIKISAIHTHFKQKYFNISEEEIFSKLKKLCLLAKKNNILVTIDAEEAERLDYTIYLLTKLLEDKDLKDYPNIGIAVQAYQKRAIYVIEYLISVAKKLNKKIPIRLVKGAYWDTEVKIAQEKNVTNYPVFKRKIFTDISYYACAKTMIENSDYIYSQFATHNATSVAMIISLANKYGLSFDKFEFQKLHGMGDNLYDYLLTKYLDLNVRIYAPVGEYRELLPYLVRRMLENGANSSFVSKISDDTVNIEDLAKLAWQEYAENKEQFFEFNNQYVPNPDKIFGESRVNSKGLDISDQLQLAEINKAIASYKKINAHSIINGKKYSGKEIEKFNPANNTEILGNYSLIDEKEIQNAIDFANKEGKNWSSSCDERIEILEKFALKLEDNINNLIAILVKEGGKTIEDAIAEVRESIDFCRYYASLVKKDFLQPENLLGVTGETNKLHYEPKGVFLCISPWNFPLAIFLGQVVAALAAGNTVIAKPAEQTPLIAFTAVKLLLDSGLPPKALSLLLCKGSSLGKLISQNNAIDGVAFTGSTEVAQSINLDLAKRKNAPIATFIAETGGLNAMIVDSTALAEQVVDDVIKSAFLSAGQRCSALRILYIQSDIYEKVTSMLKGAMEDLRVGNPSNIATDIGPIISKEAMNSLEEYEKTLYDKGNLLKKLSVDKDNGFFYGPCAFEFENGEIITEEVFGPILHIIKYNKKDIEKIINQINNKNFGLTFGVHTRINEFANYISKKIKVGNVYINRNITGAVVGSQPFGGSSLSGTGPKAGGPNYLKRFTNEKVVSNNITAAGGNASLYSYALD